MVPAIGAPPIRTPPFDARPAFFWLRHVTAVRKAFSFNGHRLYLPHSTSRLPPVRGPTPLGTGTSDAS